MYRDKVPVSNKKIKKEGPILTDKIITKLEYNLPSDYYWTSLDINNENDINQIYLLLKYNYVENDNVQLNYSINFLKWLLHNKYIIFGIKHIKNPDILLGLITGIPNNIIIKGINETFMNISLLCVHKSIRSQGFARLLLQELCNRSQINNIWYAIYTSGTNFPGIISTVKYWSRYLNIKKLIDLKFISSKLSLDKMVKLYNITPTLLDGIFRQFEKKDIINVYYLFKEYFSRNEFKISVNWTIELIEQYFLPKNNIIDSYVLEKNNEIIGFGSYYYLNNIYYGHEIKTVYSFYNIIKQNVNLTNFINQIIKKTYDNNIDIYVTSNIMNNESFFKELKFKEDPKVFHYYLYNWNLFKCNPSDIAIIMM